MTLSLVFVAVDVGHQPAIEFQADRTGPRRGPLQLHRNLSQCRPSGAREGPKLFRPDTDPHTVAFELRRNIGAL